jgi:hypothetical protein
VISQVYGGGGSNGAAFIQDFVELFNRGPTAVDISGWSIQYTAASGTAWASNITVIPPRTVIPSGHYYLIAFAGGLNGPPLPTPDFAGTTSLGGNSGKVALVNSALGLPAVNCPVSPSIVDLVGYGAADCAETAAAPLISGTLAAARRSDGCQDTNDNSVDFEARTNPTPHNSASPASMCAVECPADVNHSHAVDVSDLLAVITTWGPCPGACPPRCPADIAPAAGNCQVDVGDLLAVVTTWGPCP